MNPINARQPAFPSIPLAPQGNRQSPIAAGARFGPIFGNVGGQIGSSISKATPVSFQQQQSFQPQFSLYNPAIENHPQANILSKLGQAVTLLSNLLNTGFLKGIPLSAGFSAGGGNFLNNVLPSAVGRISQPQTHSVQFGGNPTNLGGGFKSAESIRAIKPEIFVNQLPGALGQAAPLFSAGGNLISAIAPLPSQFANLAASPGFGLIPDPVSTLGSWINFAQGKGAGQIANAWVGGYFGSKGDDQISPTSLVSFAFGGEGHDTISGGTGFLFANGGPGNDRITGATGIGNVLFGGPGNDTIQGRNSTVQRSIRGAW